ncbi:MAG: xanthine dehydrogenase family protein molybdopterin-binding subunit [Ignavibacteriaceae bacterium]
MPRKIVKSKYHFEDKLIETLGEASTEKYKPLPPDDKLKYLGKEISRIDGYDKVSGGPGYTFDIDLPHMAHSRILRSPFPNAKIKMIDTKKAEELDGVYYILTHKNAPQIKWYHEISLLFDPHLRYEGDEVACVAAENEDTAEKALKLIKVDYEELPFVVDSGNAMKADSPKVYESGNIQGKPAEYERGDVENGFKEADAVVEETYTTQVVVHNPTEVHCSVVDWSHDKLTVYDSTQGIFEVRDGVAKSLNIDQNDVRVIKKYMGGGFGSKLETGKYTVMAALLSKKIGKPVKITIDRKEMNLAVGNRPDSFQKLKGGAKKDGTLTALQHYSYGAVGAYPNGAGCSWPLKTMYKCPNVKTQEYDVFINAGRARAFRAPGHVQGIFGLDSLIDDLADKIGMDPLDFRLKNIAEIDQVFNVPYTSKLLKEAYLKGAEAIDWYKKRKPSGSGKGLIKKGLGMASQIWWGGGGPPAGALLKLNDDGSARVIAGTQDLGTGTYTFMAMVAAEILELPLEKISVTLGDTGIAPFCGSSGGSTTSPSVSPAVRDAAEKMKEKLLSAAAAIWEIPQEQLIYSEGKILDSNDKSKQITISEIIRKMHQKTLITEGAREENPKGYTTNTFGAQFAEVEVDTDTGKVKVLKIVAAHDIGRVLNKKTLENQFHGGIMQGLGYALMEDRIIDRNTGKVLTTDLHNYKIPTIADAPEIEIHIVSEGDSLLSNTGVKGIGEPAIIPTAGAIANAVYNALGVRIKSLPITPDKILKALYLKS